MSCVVVTVHKIIRRERRSDFHPSCSTLYGCLVPSSHVFRSSDSSTTGLASRKCFLGQLWTFKETFNPSCWNSIGVSSWHAFAASSWVRLVCWVFKTTSRWEVEGSENCRESAPIEGDEQSGESPFQKLRFMLMFVWVQKSTGIFISKNRLRSPPTNTRVD